MKFFTLDGTELMDIEAVSVRADGLLVEGRIMGAMPMNAVLRPDELRRGMRFLTPVVIRALIAMMFRRSRSVT